MATTAFPSTPQIPARVPLGVWRALRLGSVLAALGLSACLVLAPDTGLLVLWTLVIPSLPLVFFFAPGLWRNVCPLAALNQLPRTVGITRALTLPEPARGYSFLFAVALFLALVPARRVLFDDSGIATAALLLGALAAAFAGGLAFKGKSGWCTSFCPLLPVQRLYGQTPFAVVRNSHCNPCVGCTTNCGDFNPHAGQLADMYDEDERRGAQRKLFAGLFPGLIAGFYAVDTDAGAVQTYGEVGVYVLASLGAFYVLDSLVDARRNVLPVVFAAAALNLFYWYTLPRVLDRVADAEPWWIVWPARGAVLAVTLVWIARNVRKERRFLEEVLAPAPVELGAGASTALAEAAAESRHEVTILPDERRIAARTGATLLEIAERHGLQIEAGCRMGVCGSDPVRVTAGADNLSPIGADERATLERLGQATGTRMACCARVLGPVSMSLEAVRAVGEAVAAPAADVDQAVGRVVIVGNGIAGVTAADYIRRRHPTCEIDMVGRERHPLYNRMAITRLIYGRSAMRGLYLLPDTWYDEQRITPWLNTHVARIDRERREVVLATREVLPYDRLVITAGSSSAVPPIAGYGTPGTFVLRTAEDASEIRAYVQEHDCRRAVVVGGGLLGLEAAYALHKFGLRVTVINNADRLLPRQLDERGSHFLRRYLEGLGLEIVVSNVERFEGSEAVTGVQLRGGGTIACDLVVVAAGITPNVELAREAGVLVGRGVVVDDHMRTSDPAIFAAGDVAEHGGEIWGLWPTAVDQARVAAVNAVGGAERYAGTVPVTMLKVSGVDLTSAGRIEPLPGDVVVAEENELESRYRMLVLSENRLVGAILVGYAAEAAGVTDAVRDGRDLGPFLERLRAGDWSVFLEAA